MVHNFSLTLPGVELFPFHWGTTAELVRLAFHVHLGALVDDHAQNRESAKRGMLVESGVDCGITVWQHDGLAVLIIACDLVRLINLKIIIFPKSISKRLRSPVGKMGCRPSVLAMVVDILEEQAFLVCSDGPADRRACF